MSKSMFDTKKGTCFICGCHGPTELFKEIEGYGGKYLIGSMGTIISTEFRNNITSKERVKEMKPTDNGNGYKIVFLRDHGKRKRHYVHRLVADAFLPKPKEKNIINHKDMDKGNNAVNNLEWCTQAENVRYSSHKMKRQKSSCKRTVTGHKYIGIHLSHGKPYYRVQIKNVGGHGVSRMFKDLDSAIAYRNEVLNG